MPGVSQRPHPSFSRLHWTFVGAGAPEEGEGGMLASVPACREPGVQESDGQLLLRTRLGTDSGCGQPGGKERMQEQEELA